MEQKLYRLAIVLAIASFLITACVGTVLVVMEDRGEPWKVATLSLLYPGIIMAIFYAGRYVLTGRLRAK